ncbi:phage portal protein [Romboutsia sedimentorum]|uniref:phage portal protein n=1 Tax=Romboutsia sedimentorum TaxID=1368474 RepID=UPI0024DE326B|nr:phage portal protein [Romboutsia sedimentorum]MDK2587456.1 phage portal protein [Romboutsia sedimentorum]
MKIVDRFKSFFNKDINNMTEEERIILKELGISDVSNDEKSEVTYFTCIKILGETLGKLPLKLYQNTDKGVVNANNDVYNLIKLRPNPYMTASTFWTTVENNRNHHGNAYVWCNYRGTRLKDLWILPSEDVTLMCDNEGYFGKENKIYYIYRDKKSNKEYTINGDNILHFKTSHTFDGITGKSVREILSSSVKGGLESQKFMNNLYESGMTARAILEFSSNLDDKAKTRLSKGIENFANGSKNAGKIIPIPAGTSLKPLDLKLTDSQFFDLKKFNALQIAGAFGIKPTFVNNYDNSSHSNSEMEQLSFLVNTLQYILKQYEEEISFKLLTKKQIEEGYYFKFNEGAVLRIDAVAQADVLTKYVNNGIYTSNEVRLMLDRTTIEGADILMCNGNYIPVQQVGNQYNMKEGVKVNEKEEG